MRKETPSEYLEKYRQEPINAETQRRINELNTPWVEVEYRTDGKVETTRDNLNLAFEYVAVPKDISTIFAEKGRSDDDYFELTNLEIQDVNSGTRRNVRDVLPSDFKVYFSPYQKGEETCYVYIEEKRIVLHGSPASPRIFLALFHEIGHIYEQRNEKTFAPEQYVNRKSVDVTDIAKKVHSERDAWAFAFKYLRPLLTRTTDEQGALLADDVLAFAKNVALHSYSQGAQWDVSERRSMASFAWDYADDFDDDYWYGGTDTDKKDEE
jgi:hypothetical protein